MVDSGIAGDFLDRSLARRLGVPTLLLSRPQAVTALDGKLLEPGSITEVTHPEYILPDQICRVSFNFGSPQLNQHNPCISQLEPF